MQLLYCKASQQLPMDLPVPIEEHDSRTLSWKDKDKMREWLHAVKPRRDQYYARHEDGFLIRNKPIRIEAAMGGPNDPIVLEDSTVTTTLQAPTGSAVPLVEQSLTVEEQSAGADGAVTATPPMVDLTVEPAQEVIADLAGTSAT